MKHETFKNLLTINRIAGLLEGLSAMQDAPISKKAAILLEEASERLMMYVSDVYAKDVNGDETTLHIRDIFDICENNE